MSLNLAVDYKQVIELIDQMNEDEKDKLYKYIKQESLKRRFNELHDSLKGIPITFEEITEVVEEVRQEMYDRTN